MNEKVLNVLNNSCLLKAVVEWDIGTWADGIKFWFENIDDDYDFFGKEVLEIGGRGGGLSLLFGLLGANVTCTDYNEGEMGRAIHKKNGIDNKVNYRQLNALELNDVEKFDVICLKSVLGSIYSVAGGSVAIQKVFVNVKRALKPGGIFLFEENLSATYFHQVSRKVFHNYRWHYFDLDELRELLGEWDRVAFDTFGFLACFGRNVVLNSLLHKMDDGLVKIIPQKNRYCGSFILRK